MRHCTQAAFTCEENQVAENIVVTSYSIFVLFLSIFPATPLQHAHYLSKRRKPHSTRTRPIWQHPCFIADFCDPFLGGTGMDDGDAFGALKFLALVRRGLDSELKIAIGPCLPKCPTALTHCSLVLRYFSGWC